MLKESKAAIIEYGPSTKAEHAIIYVSEDWKELLAILESPCDFLRMKGFDNSPIAWTLLQGATVIVEPMGVTWEVAVRSARLLGVPLDPPPFRMLAPCDPMPEEVPHEGSFIAEFAVYTRTLWIRYWAPSPEHHLGPQFKGAFTSPVTHVPIMGLGIGNLHVDIETQLGKTEKHRAQFIFDYIEDGHRFTHELNRRDKERKEAILSVIGIGKGNLVDKIPADCELNSFAPSSYPPRIVIEGMSIPELPTGYCVCIDGDTREVDKEILVDGILVKCYAITPGSGPQGGAAPEVCAAPSASKIQGMLIPRVPQD